MAEASSNTSPLATFQFTAIGQTPALLKRLSDAQDSNTNPSRSPSPISSSKPPSSNIPSSFTRKPLLEALGGISTQHTAPPHPTKSSTQRQRDTSQASSFASSRTSTHKAPCGQARVSPALSGKQRTSPEMNGTSSTSQSPAGEDTCSLSANPGSVPSWHALHTRLPIVISNSASTGFPNQSAFSPNIADQQDDVLDGFRHALDRLRAEDTQYLTKAEETRFAMARQQDQAARWHARADALVEQLPALYAQCERKITSANQAIAEFERLEGLVRRHEEHAREKDRVLAALEAKNAELARGAQEQQSTAEIMQRLVDAHAAELRQVAERAVAEKVDLEGRVHAANARADILKRQLISSGERERALSASLVDQQRLAAHEKQELLDQVQEQKRIAELEKQMRLAGLEAEKLRRDGQARAHREETMRARITHAVQSNDPPIASSPSTITSAPLMTSQPTVAPAVIQKPTTHAATPAAPAKASLPSSSTSTQPQPASSHDETSRRLSQVPNLGTKSLVISPADRQPALHIFPTVKLELATPNLKTAPASTSQRAATPETPTTKVKPEPGTIGHQSASTLSSTSPPLVAPPPEGFVKPEGSTPLVDRISQPTGPNVSTNRDLRREQSLDYEPMPTNSNGATSKPSQLWSTSTTGGPSLTQRPTSRPLPPPSMQLSVAPVAPATDNVPLPNPSSVVAGIPPPPTAPVLPDLAYPSREDTPALMISTLPSDDSPMGLGFINPDDTGMARQAVGQIFREPSPAPRYLPKPAEASSQNARVLEPPLPVQPSATKTWQADHYSPTPGQLTLNKDRYTPPVRHKRTREEDEVPDRARRARLSGPSGSRSRSPPRNTAPPINNRRPSGQYDRPRSPARSRNSSPDRSRESDRYYRARPRSRSRTPPLRPPPESTYHPAYERGPPTNGYAPTPPPATAHPESEVRFPQVVPAPPAPANSRHVQAPVAPSRRAKQRAAAPTSAEPIATPAAGGQVYRPTSPASEVPMKGSGSLLNRIQLSPAEGSGSSTTTPAKQKKAVAKNQRGGIAARGSTPVRGRRGGNPSTRGRNVSTRGGDSDSSPSGGVSSIRGGGFHSARRGGGTHLTLADRMGLGEEDMV
ncbi:hypothetical protein BC628DRAFT_1423310 [Trametes gibbosa]|nr:hypothetical protein BC628DRAFT_1423310 [Trametes gibbosa]